MPLLESVVPTHLHIFQNSFGYKLCQTNFLPKFQADIKIYSVFNNITKGQYYI